MAFLAPADEAVDEGFSAPSTDQVFTAPEEDSHEAVKASAEDDQFQPEQFASLYPSGHPMRDFAYNVKKERDLLPIRKKLSMIHPGDVAVDTLKSLGMGALGIGSAVNYLGRKGFHTAEAYTQHFLGNEDAAETAGGKAQSEGATALLGAQQAELATEGTLGHIGHGLERFLKSVTGNHGKGKGAEVHKLSPEEIDALHRQYFDENVDVLSRQNQVAAGIPLDTGVAATISKTVNSGVKPSELYSPEALKASNAPQADATASEAIGAGADPNWILLSEAGNVPGAHYIGGKIVQGTGKAIKAASGAIEGAGKAALGTGKKYTASGLLTAAAMGHAEAAGKALAAAGAGKFGGKAGRLFGEALEERGRMAAGGAPGRMAEAVRSDIANSETTGKGALASFGQKAGESAVGAASTAVGMAPLNAATSEGDLGDFVENEVGAAAAGAVLGPLAHRSRPEQDAISAQRMAEFGATLGADHPDAAAHADAMAEAPAWFQNEVNKFRAEAYGDGSNPMSVVVLKPAEFQAKTGTTSRGVFNPDTNTMYLNIGDKAAGKARSTAGHEWLHGALEAIGDAKGEAAAREFTDTLSTSLTADQKTEIAADYLKRFSAGGGVLKAGMTEADVMEEALAEHARKILDGEDISHFALPKPVKEKIADAISAKLRDFSSALGVEQPGVGKNPDEQMAFNVRHVKAATEKLRNLLYERGNKAREFWENNGAPAASQDTTPPAPAVPPTPASTAAPAPAAGNSALVSALVKGLGLTPDEAAEWAKVAKGKTMEEQFADAVAKRREKITSQKTKTAASAPATAPLSPVKPGEFTTPGYTADAPLAGATATAVAEAPPKPLEGYKPNEETTTLPADETGAETNAGNAAPPPDVPTPAKTGRENAPLPTPEEVQNTLGQADAAAASLKPERRVKARQDALRSILPAFDARSAPVGEEAPEGLHVHTDAYGKTSVRGNIDPENPLHAALLKEAGITPEQTEKITAMQGQRGKVTYIDYDAAKVSGDEHSAEQRAKELAESPAEERAKGAEATQQINKAVIPLSTKLTSTGKAALVVYSPDKLHSNALAVVRAANDAGFAHGYEGSESEINKALSRDIETYTKNHANGRSGDGSVELRPDAGPAEPFRDAEGNPLDPETARQRQDVLNMAANDTGATETARQANRIARYDEAMRQWEAGGQQGKKPRKPPELGDKAKVEEQEAHGLAAYGAGYRNPVTGEPNKLRDALSGEGFDPVKNLESPFETLRPELIRDVRDQPAGDRSIVRPHGEPVGRLPDSKAVRAGFMPETGKDDPLASYGKSNENADTAKNIADARMMSPTDPAGFLRKMADKSRAQGKEDAAQGFEAAIAEINGDKPLPESEKSDADKAKDAKIAQQWRTMPENEDNLVVVHNLSIDNLRHVLKMGGIAVPSMAIVRTDRSNFTNFGEITLIARKELIDPKRDKSSKVFNADAYSPRYPSVKVELTPKATKQFAEFFKSADFQRGYGDTIDGLLSEIKDQGFERAFRGSARVAQKFLQEKGVEIPKAEEKEDNWHLGHRIVNEALKYSSEKAADDGSAFDKWIAELPEREGWETKERIFDGFTNSGNRRYLSHDLDTVVRILKRKLQDGEGFNYGVPSIRATVAKKFKSVADIQKSRESVIPEAEMKKLKEETDAEFLQLAEDVAPHRSLDSFSDDMKALAEGGTENWRHLREMYPEGVPAEKMKAFLDKLRTMPTEYFEAKLQRAVGLHEFEGAVIPDNTPADLKQALQKRGLQIEEYPKGDAAKRKEAVESVATGTKARFMPDDSAKNEDAPLAGFKRDASTQEADAGAPLKEARSIAQNTKEPAKNTPEFKKWFADSAVKDESGEPKVVYHSTSAPEFNKFKRRLGDIGIHFGTQEQAADRFEYGRERGIKTEKGARTYPVYLSIKNPLRLNDAGAWNADNLEYQLKAKFGDEPVKNAMRSSRSANGKLAALRDLIEAKGYDGIVYKNTGEVGGSEPFRKAQKEAREALAAAQKVRGKPMNGFDAEDQATPEYKAYSEAMDAYAKHREDNGEDSWIAFRPKQIKSATGNSGEFDPKDADIRHMPEDYDREAKWYHGTTAKKDFKTFKEGDGELGKGIYVTSEPDAAGAWARGDKGRIIPLHIKKGDLFDLNRLEMGEQGVKGRAEAVQKAWEEIAQRFKDRADAGEIDNELLADWAKQPFDDLVAHIKESGKTQDERNRWLKEAGYIGATKKGSQIRGQAVIFDPTYLKSATANKGTFDPSKPDIRHMPEAQSDKLEKEITAKGYDIERKELASGGYLRFTVTKDGEDAAILELHKYPASNYAEVGAIFVEPGHRGNKIAELLYRKAANELQAEGIKRIGGDVMSQAPMNLRKKVFGKFDMISGTFQARTEAEVRDRLPAVKEDLNQGNKFFVSNKIRSRGRYMPAGDTDSPEFKRWFEGSKITDEEGDPKIVYHGGSFTTDEDGVLLPWTHFGTKGAAQERIGAKPGDDLIASVKTFHDEDGSLGEPGKWYFEMDGYEDETPYESEEEAKKAGEREAANQGEQMEVDDYGAHITPVYLNLRNPLRMSDLGTWGLENVIRSLPAKAKLTPEEREEIGKLTTSGKMGEDFDKLTEILRAKGYDGIVYRNEFEDKGSDSYITFDSKQAKSAEDNTGEFDPNDPDIRHMPATESAETKAKNEKLQLAAYRRDRDRKGRFVEDGKGQPVKPLLRFRLQPSGSRR